MKKIMMLLMVQSCFIQAFSITNSSESTIPVVVVITKKAEMGRFKLFNIQSEYNLKPGQHGAWHKDAIWRKLKQNTVTAWIYNKGANIWKNAPLIVIEKMPINAALEIYAVKDGTGYKAAALDFVTGQAYNSQAGFKFKLVEDTKKVTHKA